jgi:hypothetical protein
VRQGVASLVSNLDAPVTEVTNPKPTAEHRQTPREELGVPLCGVNIGKFDPFRIDYFIPFCNAKVKERH